METLTVEQMEVINDSDALCETCGANPREVEALAGWFIDSVVDAQGDRLAQIRCPQCW